MASGLCAALTGRTHGCTDQPANVKKTLANSEPKADVPRRRPVCRFRAKADRHARVASTASVLNDPTRTLRVNSFCDAQCYFFRVRSPCGDGRVHLTRTPSRKRRTAAWTRFSMASRVRGWRSGLREAARPRTRLRNMSAASSGSPTLISFRST